MTTIQMKAGATETDIQAALAKLASGDTLVLAANETIQIKNGLNIDASSRSITFDLNGSTLQQAGDCGVIWVDGRTTAPAAATLGHTSTGAITVTAASLGSVKVGDTVKVFSDDSLPNDQGAVTRLGQAMKVAAVNGTTVTLTGDLVNADLYKTNIRVTQIQSGTVNIVNGTVRGDQKHADWQDGLVNVRSTLGTHIDHLTVRDGNSMGINFANTVNGLVTQTAVINLTDDTAHGHYGYGVHSASSVGTTVDGLYAEKVRHAVDDNAVGLSQTDANPSKYGADIGLTATNVVANGTTAFAFSWHSEGRYGNYSDSAVFNSFGVVGARGTDNTAHDISGANNQRGLDFFEYGDGDGQRLLMDHINLKETAAWALYNQGDPKNNVLSNSIIEVKDSSTLIPANSATITFTNDVVKTGTFVVDEVISGGSDDDQLLGGSGVDTISGGAGRDYIVGGAGADVLTGGAGSDRFAYIDMTEAGDTITDFAAGAGGDVIDLSALKWHYGWSGDLFANGYVRYLQSGSDTLVQVDTNGGGDSFVTLVTLKKEDAKALVAANVSSDVLVSDYDHAGPVVVSVAAASTAVAATPPAASSAGSVLLGGGGSLGSATSATVALGTGLSVASGYKPLTGSMAFTDLVGYKQAFGTTGADTLTGTSKSDLIIGGAGDDKLNGGLGDDFLSGGAGVDMLTGGGGNDTASYADAAVAVIASLANSAVNTGDAAGDKYMQIANLTGSAFADTLTGNESGNVLDGKDGNDMLFGNGGADTLRGGNGDDVLDGGAKSDVLIGGAGNDKLIGGDSYDTLTGGAGSDTFVFDLAYATSSDTVTDFEIGIDKIGMSHTGLASLAGAAFETGGKCTTDHATILYNAATGVITYDKDGTGAGAAIKIGTVTPGLDLHLTDFVLI